MADISKINLGGVEYDIRDQKLKGELAEVATSGSYGDLKDKPSIPAAVTEQTVKDWGFTKNEGTYSKPAGGIPYSDMAQGVKESLDKAGTALQSGDLQAINQRVNALAEEAERLEADKQDVLSDGVNIKTINGQSILGKGNIKIEGGGSSVEVVDSLDSEDTTAALSANQGRRLKEMIEELPSGGGGGGNMDAYFVKEFDEYFDDVFTN